jgi:hypothetical protein
MTYINPHTLIRLSIELENQLTANGDLVSLPGKDITLYVISQYENGWISHFHQDIPSQIRSQISSLDPLSALNDEETIKRILSQHITCDEVFPGIGYYFAEAPPETSFPDVIWHQGCYVVFANGAPVSWAWSSESNQNAVELAVETDVPYRRKGYARQVASAWAYHNIRDGKVAFYSHRVDNTPSQRLAVKLGVVRYARISTYAASKRQGSL